MSKPRIPKSEQKKIAKDQINHFFSLASREFPLRKGLANRYVTLARKIAMKYKVRMPKEHKRRYCKHCYKYLKPAVNSRTRIQHNKVIITCFECTKITRIPLNK